jgi:CheY-like chemotaxis protein
MLPSAQAKSRVTLEGRTAMNVMVSETLAREHNFAGSIPAARPGIVALYSDSPETIAAMTPVCEFLELRLEVISAGTDLTTVLRTERPLAVISDVEGVDHDGFHVMKMIARYNPDLPLMLLTGGDPAMMGAADAIQELWGLTQVTQTSGFPLAGQLVSFLFAAGRRAGCMRLVPV